jgi:segregation and condensation protein B
MQKEVTAKSIIESLVFTHPEPLDAGLIVETVMAREDGFELSTVEVDEIIADLNRDYSDSGRCFSIIRIGGGYAFATHREYHPWLQQLQHENSARKLSQSALEVLSIIAFRQPVTKPEVDHIRGVDSGYVIRQLLEKELVDVAGRNDSPGRPLLYRTNGKFLKHFGINSIDDLPKPREIEEILQDDDMAQHRQLILELKAELVQNIGSEHVNENPVSKSNGKNNSNGSANGHEETNGNQFGKDNDKIKVHGPGSVQVNNEDEENGNDISAP